LLKKLRSSPDLQLYSEQTGVVIVVVIIAWLAGDLREPSRRFTAEHPVFRGWQVQIQYRGKVVCPATASTWTTRSTYPVLSKRMTGCQADLTLYV